AESSAPICNAQSCPTCGKRCCTISSNSHPTDEAVRPGIIKEIFRRYPAVLRSREAVQILAHAQWWAPSMVQEVLSEWPTDTARMRQAYAELVALIAVMQPSLSWAADALGNMLSNSVDR